MQRQAMNGDTTNGSCSNIAPSHRIGNVLEVSMRPFFRERHVTHLRAALAAAAVPWLHCNHLIARPNSFSIAS